MTCIVTTAEIGRPVEEVFDYVATPANWPIWHPSSLAVSGATDHPLGVGEQVTEEFRVAGRRGTVVWTVREAAAPRRWVIEGEIVGRGGGGTITYSVSPTPRGARFEREFVYEIHSPIMRALDWLVIRQRVAGESEEALRRLKVALEGVESAGGARSDLEASRPNDYRFVTRWRVEGRVEEVAAIVEDAPSLARWWPAVYLQVDELSPGDELGVGKHVRLWTKGWLPYTLRWEFRVVESSHPHGFTLEARGDFVGMGVWTFEQDASYVDVTYDWRVRAEKPLLRRLSFLLRPVFAANHRWAMAQGEKSLQLELARRHAATPEAATRVPAPPGPTSLRSTLLPLAAIGALAVGLVYRLGQLARRGAEA